MDRPLSNDDAALVFRRAAELEAEIGSTNSPAVLDEATLLEIGRETGLSEAAVRRALADLRNGLLEPEAAPGWIGPRVVKARRVVRGQQAAIAESLNDALSVQLFERLRNVDTLQVFGRRGDVGAQLARGFKQTRLRAARTIEASVVPTDDFTVEVTLSADLGPTRGAAVFGMSAAGVEATAGTAVGAGLGVAVNPAFLLIAAPALAIGAGLVMTVRTTYRATARRTQLALEGLLDALSSSAPDRFATGGQ